MAGASREMVISWRLPMPLEAVFLDLLDGVPELRLDQLLEAWELTTRIMASALLSICRNQGRTSKALDAAEAQLRRPSFEGWVELTRAASEVLPASSDDDVVLQDAEPTLEGLISLTLKEDIVDLTNLLVRLGADFETSGGVRVLDVLGAIARLVDARRRSPDAAPLSEEHVEVLLRGLLAVCEIAPPTGDTRLIVLHRRFMNDSAGPCVEVAEMRGSRVLLQTYDVSRKFWEHLELNQPYLLTGDAEAFVSLRRVVKVKGAGVDRRLEWQLEVEAEATESPAEPAPVASDVQRSLVPTLPVFQEAAPPEQRGAAPLFWRAGLFIAVGLVAATTATVLLWLMFFHATSEATSAAIDASPVGETAAAAEPVRSIVVDATPAEASQPMRSPPEGMVLIPGVEGMLLGSGPLEWRAALEWCRAIWSGADEVCSEERFSREAPVRSASVPAFFLDETEVTNEAFVRWLRGRDDLAFPDGDEEMAVRDLAGHPLVFVGGEEDEWAPIVLLKGTVTVRRGRERRPARAVTWYGAEQFCASRGATLPTEEQWELAARGRERRRFPWGNEAPTCSSVVYHRVRGGECESEGFGPAEVRAGRGDRTPEGVVGLAGNVSEWIADTFSPSGQEQTCTSPTEGALCRVVRGGSFAQDAERTRGAARGWMHAGEQDTTVGFRCAQTLQTGE
jgi:formylglycine-generating enzyme required for sulfatase activity